MDGKKSTYQFAAGKEGWRSGEIVVINDITHETAITIGYGYALLFGTEVRAATIDAGNPRATKELLGNGIYLHPMNAKFN